MPDYGPALGALLETLAPVLGPALRALVRTTVGMVVFGLCCLAVAEWAVADAWLRALLLGVPGGIALVGVTGVLGVKNAVLNGVLGAVQKLQVGARTVGAIFTRLGVSDDAAPGAVGRTAQRLPLGQAERRLTEVVEGLLQERAAKTGLRAWLARKLMTSVVTRVQALTLARFRAEATQDGVDLLKVRAEFEGSVDALLAAQVEAQLNRLNVFIAGAYALGVTVLAVGVHLLPLK
jgi:hypothetical protein